MTKTPFQLHDILMPLHTESDSCDQEYFHAKKRLEYFPFLGFAVKEKFFDTIWQPHFPSGDHENISVASWRLPNKSYFGPCVA